MERADRKHARGRAGRIRVVCVLLALLCPNAIVQGAVAPAGRPNPDPKTRNLQNERSIFREIVDASNGLRWVVLRDDGHSGRPGRLVPAKPEDEVRSSAGSAGGGAFLPAVAMPCIHAGDRVLVEEHTAAADGYLEAVAMEPAVPGSVLRLRLKIGGRIVRAVAVAPGKAELAVAAETAR